VTEGRDDEAHARNLEELPLRRRALTTQVEASEESLANTRKIAKQADEDRPREVAEQGLRQQQLQGQVADSNDARRRRNKDFAAQAEAEGIKMLSESLEAGVDARAIESRFNQQGAWKIKPGTLTYDAASKKVSFQGAGGQQFNGDLKQLRALFGAGGGKAPLIKGDTDTVFYDENGQAVTRPGGGGGNGKITQPTKLSIQDKAAEQVEKAYKHSWNPEAKVFTFGNANDTDRAIYGGSQAQVLVSEFLDEGVDIPPAVAGDIALKASRAVVSAEEAKTAAEDELKNAVPPRNPEEHADWVTERAKQIQDNSYIKAGQALKDAKIEYKNSLKKKEKSDKEVSWSDLK
jgi:hypothetical protein